MTAAAGERSQTRPLQAPVRLLFPEATDERVVAATHRLAVERPGIVPVLLDDGEAVAESARREGRRAGAVEVLAPGPLVASLAGECAAIRSLPVGAATHLLERPAYLAAMLLRTGRVDGMLAGAASPTGDVLLACQALLGFAPGASLATSFFVLELPAGRPYVFADCSVNPEPTAPELADIAINAAEGARAILGVEPRVAMLSFSTHGSTVHPAVDKVAEATRLVRLRAPKLLVDGELQADAAVNPEVARRKLVEPGPVAGRANVLVFPDLDAGNIGYKLVAQLAGAAAYGTFLQGFAKPAVDLSRGATTDEIVETATMLARLVDARRA